MSSLESYLKTQGSQLNKQLENLVSGLSTNKRNAQVIQALGGTDASKPQRSFLDKVLSPFGIGQRLVQGGILSAIGRPNEEMQKASSTIDLLRGLTSGRIHVSGTDFPTLTPDSTDDKLTKFSKAIGGFGVDIATDPLTYIEAPATIARSKAATNVVEHFKDVANFEKVANAAKDANFVEKLVAKAPVSKAAQILETTADAAKAGVAGEVTAPVVAEAAQRATAAKQLGDQLGTSLLTRGRGGVLKDLTEITGSKSEALKLFKTLPEEAQGGLMFKVPFSGKKIRLTSGTGQWAEPVFEAGNKARLAVGATAGDPWTRFFSGKFGSMLADVKKAEWYKEIGQGRKLTPEMEKATLANYVDFRKAYREGLQGTRGKLQALTHTAVHDALQTGKEFTGDAKNEWEAAKNLHLSDATLPVPADASPAYKKGAEAASILRADMMRSHAAGVEIGAVGTLATPETQVPLVLKEEANTELNKLGVASGEDNTHMINRSRDSFVTITPDADVMAAVEARRIPGTGGFTDPKNPGVIYSHPIAVNDELEKRAYDLYILGGKSKEEAAALAKNARAFIEDPILLAQTYGQIIANKVATYRFTKMLEETGVLIRDIPEARKLIQEENAATMVAGIRNIKPEVLNFYKKRAEAARAKLEEVVSMKNIDAARKKIAAVRVQAVADAEAAAAHVGTLQSQLDEVTAAVEASRNETIVLSKEARDRTENLTRTEAEIAARQNAAKNVRARINTAQKNVNAAVDRAKIVEELFNAATDPAEQNYYYELYNELTGQVNASATKLATEKGAKAAVASELDTLRQAKASTTGELTDMERKFLDTHEQNILRQNELETQLAQAKSVAREKASAARKLETKLAFEQKTAINTIVEDYQITQKDLEEFIRTNKITKATPAEEAKRIKDETARLRALARDSEKRMREVFKGASEENGLKEYADAVLSAAKDLTSEELSHALVLTDSSKIDDMIQTYVSVGREEAMTAIGEIYDAFARMREKLPDDIYDSLEVAQRKMFEGFGDMRPSLFRNEMQPGKIGQTLWGQGYVSMGNYAQFKDLYGSASTLDAMNQIFKLNRDPSAWEQAVKVYLDPILSMWKLAATTGRGPAFVINNVVGGMYNNYLGGVGLKWVGTAWSTVSEMRSTVKALETKFPEKSFVEITNLAEEAMKKSGKLNKMVGDKTVAELWQDFRRLGAMEDTDISAVTHRALQQEAGVSTATLEDFTAKGRSKRVYDRPAANKAEEAIRKATDIATSNGYQRFMTDMAQESEAFLRFQAFLAGYEKSKNLDVAMNLVHMLHFDYQDLNSGEEWLRRMVPFYTWARNNVPLQLRSILMQPGKIRRIMAAQGNLQAQFAPEEGDSWMNQFLPDYLQEQGGKLSQFKIGPAQLAFQSALPFSQLNDFFTLNGIKPGVNMRGVLSSLGPGIKVPLSAAMGRDIATDNPIQGNILNRTLQDMFPQWETGRRVIDSASQISGAIGGPRIKGARDEKDLQSLIKLSGAPGLLGLRSVNVTPSSITGELMRRSSIQSAQIKDLAASLKVDPDWVRNALDKGLRPEQIALLVKSGQGKAKKPQDIKSTLSKKTRNRVLNIING